MSYLKSFQLKHQYRNWVKGRKVLQLLNAIINIFILVPIAILFHEMGHAMGILTSTKNGIAEIFLGSRSKEKKINLYFKRIHFHLTIAFSGFCSIFNREEIPPLTNKQKLIFDSAGPLFSLLCFVLSYSFSFVFDSFKYTLNMFSLINLVIFIASALPYKYPSYEKHLAGYETDGLRFINTVKKMRQYNTLP